MGNAHCRFCRNLYDLWSMPQEEYDTFFASYDVMDQERITCRADEDRVVDWYRVLNRFCALGAVEKMYIPPVLDATKGNVDNQRLFEEKMARELGLGKGKVGLDLGCGKGRIAHEVATYSGCKMVGLNYDQSQIDSAEEFAAERGLLGSRLEFHYGSFNDKLPFGDAQFDGGYEVGAFCYAIDKVALFKEIWRVLKPGAKFSYCDWCRLNYDEKDEHHRELLRHVKPLTGMVEMPFPREVEEAMRQAGFAIEFSGEASTGGKQMDVLVGDVEGSFKTAECMVKTVTCCGGAPNLDRLWTRIRDGGEALQEAVELDLFTMSWQVIGRKVVVPVAMPKTVVVPTTVIPTTALAPTTVIAPATVIVPISPPRR